MRKIKLISTTPHGACSYYRSLGVLSKLPNINLEMLTSISWTSLIDTDIVFMERPNDPSFVDGAKLIKKFGIKIWVDFDDDLFCVPAWNPASKFYGSKDVQDSIIKTLEMADIVTVATPGIKEKLLEYNNNIEVVPNSFNDFNFKFEKRDNRNKRVLWRGSETHLCDIETCLKSIVDLSMERKKEWSWYFIGNNLYLFLRFIENSFEHNELDIVKYFHEIVKIAPSIYIAPLQDCTFNRAKSNCGWLEATFAGACTVAPDLPEWHKPGIMNYKNNDDFKKIMDELMDNLQLRSKNYLRSYEHIKSNLLLSKINKKRFDIVEKLC